MRCCSVNNNAHKVNVYPAPATPVTAAGDQAPRNNSIRNSRYSGLPIEVGNGVKKSMGAADVFSLFSKLKAFAESLFDKLSNFVAGRPSGTLETTHSRLRLKPETLPERVPEPTPSTPDLAGYVQGLSMKRNGEKANDIFGGFRQGPDGNCVTVSAIKAAMHRFGQSPTDIYQKVTKTAEGYRVLMRDNFTLDLTDDELKQGARGSRFVGYDKELLKDAQFLYAVSAKRAQMENNDGTASGSFYAAMRSLNDKEDEFGAGEGFLRLGLSKHMRTVHVRDLARGQVGMSNRAGHSVAVIDGYEELWGKRGKSPRRGDAIALV